MHTEDSNGSSHGSGTCLGWDADSGLIITAWHVIKDNHGQARVDFFIDRETVTLDAKIVAVDRLWDLAALVVKRPNWDFAPFMRLGKNKPMKGDKITLSGFGRAGLRTYRDIEGVVVGFCAPSATAAYDLLVVDVASRNGDSGGPMRSENGLLVGVLFGSDGATHGSHCERIRLFLDPLKGRFPDLIRMIFTTYLLFEPK